MKTNLKLADGFYLNEIKVRKEEAIEVSKPVNHIFVVDVSYSMCDDLPKIKTQLKNKLSNVMREGDTISIVWFSGDRDCGILKEEVEVKSLKTLTDLNNAIDRWLNPVGCTAFRKPLDLVYEIIGRIKSNRPESLYSMIFLTDGYNNDCPWKDVIASLKKLDKELSAATFVEYGYYADSKRITEMASIVGGEKISTSGFDEFEPIFDDKISGDLQSGKKIPITLDSSNLYDFAFSIDNGNVLLYNVNDNNEIMVNENITSIYYFSDLGIGNTELINPSILYGAIYVLSDKLEYDAAEQIFYTLGDNFYYQKLLNSFGKEKLVEFKTAIKECVKDPNKQHPNGVESIRPIPDDAYCLMNLINDLSNIEGCLFYPNHESFNYKRIGAKREQKAKNLSDDNKKELSEAKTVDDVVKILEDLKSKNVELKFINSNPERGYPLTDLVWNTERANLGVRIYIDGSVKLPENKFGIDEVSSFKYNTFTVIKDGIINIKKLPLLYSDELHELLEKNGVSYILLEKYDALCADGSYGRTLIVDLTSIPIINKKMINSISAKTLAEKEWKLMKLKADKKVYDSYKKLHFPKTSKSYLELLGAEASEWLKEIGITDFNGFQPKTDAVKSEDFYMSVNLITKIKGLSSLPKVEIVESKVINGDKLKLAEWIMSDAVSKYISQINSEIFTTLSEDQQKSMLKTYLETKYNILNKQRHKALQEIAEIKFSLILSRKWFTEFKSFDENTIDLNLDGQPLKFTFDLCEKQVNI